MTELSIVIPAYLEQENLALILPQLESTLRKMEVPSEVIVVDTSEEMDNTRIVCEKFQFVKYINRTPGNSYGDAIRSGILSASGRFVIFMDADGSHSPDFIEELYKNKERGDIVIASRYIEGGHTDNNLILIMMSYIVNTLYSIILNLKCKDVSNSFKLYSKTDLDGITLKCSNFDIVEEMLYKIKRRNDKLVMFEIPYSFKKRVFGETKRNLFKFIFSFCFTLIKLRFSKK